MGTWSREQFRSMVRSEKRACLSTVQIRRRTEGVMVRRNSIHKDIWGTVSQVRKFGSLAI